MHFVHSLAPACASRRCLPVSILPVTLLSAHSPHPSPHRPRSHCRSFLIASLHTYKFRFSPRISTPPGTCHCAIPSIPVLQSSHATLTRVAHNAARCGLLAAAAAASVCSAVLVGVILGRLGESHPAVPSQPSLPFSQLGVTPEGDWTSQLPRIDYGLYSLVVAAMTLGWPELRRLCLRAGLQRGGVSRHGLSTELARRNAPDSMDVGQRRKGAPRGTA